MPVSEAMFERVALEDPDGNWELHCGRLQQLPLDEFLVSGDRAYVRLSPTRTYLPDAVLIPRALADRMDRDEPNRLEVYRDLLPLVVEIWSPSTGKEDLSEKLAGYGARGDAEIWLIHPRERTLLASVRGAGGTYSGQIYQGGMIRPAALPGVSIDLDELFRLQAGGSGVPVGHP